MAAPTAIQISSALTSISVAWSASTFALIERPDSGKLSRGERITFVQRFDGKYADCITACPWRGAAGASGLAGWFVSQADVDKEEGGQGILNVTWEPGGGQNGGGSTLPPTRLSIKAKTFRVPLIQHARYSTLRTAAFAEQLWRYTYPKDSQELTDAASQMVTIGDGITSGRGTEFVGYLYAGYKEVDVPGLICQITSHSWTFPAMTVGGAVSTSGPTLPDSATWPSGYVFRRLPDEVDFNDSYWTKSSVFEAAPSGTWDTVLGS